MIPPGQANHRPEPGVSCPEPSRRRGSVKRARQLLEAGVRPTRGSHLVSRPSPPQPIGTATNQTQWPLPASGLQPEPLNPHHPRFMAPRGPPPLRPPRPSEVPSQTPSPSVYSIRSGESAEPSLPSNYKNPYPYPTRPTRSFSHPNPRPNQQPAPGLFSNQNSAVSPTSSVEMMPRISIETDDLFRHSTYSASSSTPYMHPAPPAEPPMPQPRFPAAGLVIPPNVRRSRVRRSSVSPIPEEIPNPRLTLGSYASSRAIPSSWGSGPAESEILGAYLDDGSSDDEAKIQQKGPEELNPVRSASLGKRHKPTVRTIMKSNPSSEVSMPGMHDTSPLKTRLESKPEVDGMTTTGTGTTGKDGKPSAQAEDHEAMRTSTPVLGGSISSLSNESWVDFEKPRFAKDDEQNTYRGALEKQLEILPKAAPAMSDKRPNGRKPPRLDMDAVRGAEARGSLSSLTDLIRRATRLASNLDHGRTASRADLTVAGADFRDLGHRGRNSGSLSDILASFPNPSVVTPDTRSSWPVFFGRSHLRNAEPLASHDDAPDESNPRRRCCGMPRKWFILLCVLIFIVVALAILLPVFLVAVPREKAHNDSCSHTAPCKNGGVSVSSGTECSCVCVDGYTGSQCTTTGDSSCVTAEVNNGSIDKNATMGSSIPTLLDQSHAKFGIELDAVTIMALFSMDNVSCQTENSLVSFSEIDHSNKSRRSITLPVEAQVNSFGQEGKQAGAPSSTSSTQTQTSSDSVSPVMEERSLATSNGIYYDSESAASSGARVVSTSSETQASATATPTTSAASTTTSSQATATTTGTDTSSSAVVPSEVLEFSRVAVLYILEKTGSFDSALESETQIQTYLVNSYQSADHPVVTVLEWYTLNFENRTITTG